MSPYVCGVLIPVNDRFGVYAGTRLCGEPATHAEVGFKNGGPIGEPLVTVPAYPNCARHAASHPHPADLHPLADPKFWDEVAA
jgi:hypothetical protein